VTETLQPLPEDRKCFRLINGVLVERTVKDVLPALKTNSDGLKQVLEELLKQYKGKEDEMNKWKVMTVSKLHGIVVGGLTGFTEKAQYPSGAKLGRWRSMIEGGMIPDDKKYCTIALCVCLTERGREKGQRDSWFWKEVVLSSGHKGHSRHFPKCKVVGTRRVGLFFSLRLTSTILIQLLPSPLPTTS
jgi:hypothetical protein